MTENTKRLKEMLDVAQEQGIIIYQGERVASPEDILQVQMLNEDANYMPDFVVKDEQGDIKEIWYGEVRKRNYY